jgi:threonine aldolase
MHAPAIDLRSDTVTKPTAAMRRAMAEAPVGDDVYGEDPTVNRLQETVAALLATEAALFVPTGTMANQLALRVHTRHGDDVIVGTGAHNALYESGAAGALAGVQLTPVGSDGRFTGADVEAAFKPDDHHRPASRLVSVENTHNLGGGVMWEVPRLAEVVATAKRLGMSTHLDGARLWNAARASGVPEHELCRGFDTISVCLSKGLGAPVGSLLAGSRALIHAAHRYRKMYGGGMRQAGVLAAAGLYALDHHRQRLGEDHAHAALLASGLAAIDGVELDPARVQTNIVMLGLGPGLVDGATAVRRAAERGLLIHAMGARRLRLVTHLDVDRAACERAVEILAAAVRL